MKAQKAANGDKARKPLWPRIRTHKVGEKTYWLIDAGKIGGRRQRFVRTLVSYNVCKLSEKHVGGSIHPPP